MNSPPLTRTEWHQLGQRRTSSLPALQELTQNKMQMHSLSTSKQASGQYSFSGSHGPRWQQHHAIPQADGTTALAKTRLKNRLLQQNGDYNISMTHVRGYMQKYYSDMWTTLTETKWRWALLAFAMSFILSWLVFSTIYLCIMYAHGDLDHENDWRPCIVSVDTFSAVFMFSLETQTTIGYGFRYPNDECPQVLYTICLQSMVGVVIQTLLVGVVFARLVTPKNRAQAIQFSRCCVISVREGKLCLMFRVGDLRKTHLASIKLRMFMISKHVTPEGEVIPFHIREMMCKVGDVEGCPLLTWPIIVCHTIDKQSPLYHMSRLDMISAKFEIHVVLDGVTPTNGMSTTARTSYVPIEIHWGHRLDGLITYQTELGEYKIDYSKFHSIHPVWTSSCSALELEETESINSIINEGMCC